MWDKGKGETKTMKCPHYNKHIKLLHIFKKKKKKKGKNKHLTNNFFPVTPE